MRGCGYAAACPQAFWFSMTMLALLTDLQLFLATGFAGM